MNETYTIEWRETSTGLRAPYIDDEPVSFDCVPFAEESNRLLALNAEMLEVLEETVACGIIPSSSAKDGGAARFSEQVRVADKVRAVISKAKGEYEKEV